MLRPDEATKGYYLAPTLFGDVFLNFGYLGIIFILFFFGFASGHIDRLYFEKNSQGIFIIFTTFYTYYSILRNNLSDSLFFIFMIYVFFKIIKFFSRKIHQHENINRY
jgi:oligosaccharide repeat unit polymerase